MMSQLAYDINRPPAFTTVGTPKNTDYSNAITNAFNSVLAVSTPVKKSGSLFKSSVLSAVVHNNSVDCPLCLTTIKIRSGCYGVQISCPDCHARFLIKHAELPAAVPTTGNQAENGLYKETRVNPKAPPIAIPSKHSSKLSILNLTLTIATSTAVALLFLFKLLR